MQRAQKRNAGPGRPRLWLVLLVVGVLVSSAAPAAAVPQAPRGHVPVPPEGAYLGAYVGPYVHEDWVAPWQEVERLPLFHRQVPRKVAILSVYQPWREGLAQNEALHDIADTEGAIPMVSWQCGDTDANIISGRDDDFIAAYARQLKGYGRPVLLRWFWEANLMQRPDCLYMGVHGASPSQKAHAYQQAFRHIYTIFQRVGADNVAFVWCPSTARMAVPMAGFYPGDDYVDWIGADGYDRRGLGKAAFAHQFGDWYQRYQGKGKPMMVAETGAAAADQAAFLRGVARVVPTQFPKIKAVVYFNAETYKDWQLKSAGGGVDAFRDLGSTRFFRPMPPSP